MSGTVLWCFRCGVYGDKKAKGLRNECKGRPPRQAHRGGMEGQLRKLRNGIHPKTGEHLPKAVELDPVVVSLRASNMDVQSKPPDGFYTYVPADEKPVATVVVEGGLSSTERRLAFLDRIRAKERANSHNQGKVLSEGPAEQPTCSNTGHTSDNTTGEVTDGDGSSTAHKLTSGPVIGGGVWSYLFPGEDQSNGKPCTVVGVPTSSGSGSNKEASDSRGWGAGWRTPPPGEMALNGDNRSCQAHWEAAPLPPSSLTTSAESLPAMAVVGGHPKAVEAGTPAGWRTPPPESCHSKG